MKAEDDLTPLLSLRGVRRSFPGDLGRDAVALSRVDLDVAAGEMLAIVGPSGSGKSTLLNILGLLDIPTSGRYLIGGDDTSKFSEGRRNSLRASDIGFIFQESYVDRSLSVAENVALGLRASGTSLPDCERPVLEALRRVNLSGTAATSAAVLSGGERQRVAIARALAATPKILLADEPTGSLDRENGNKVVEVLRGLARDGLAVVVITHDEQVAASADRIVRIVDGDLLDSGSGRIPQTTAARPQAQRRHPQLAGAIRDGVNGILVKPLRSLALIAAFALGSGGFVAASILSDTASEQVSERITAAGLDEIKVGADGIESGALLDAIRQLPHVQEAGTTRQLDQAAYAVSRFSPMTVTAERAVSGRVLVADTSYLTLTGASISPSNAITLFSRDFTKKSVIIGEEIAKGLGIISPPLGDQSIVVGGERYSVIGVAGSGSRDYGVATSVFVPESSGIGTAPTYVVRTDPGYPAVVAEAIPLALSPANPGAVKVSTVADLRDLRRGVASDLGSLITYLALLLVVMATLGAGATMSLSVRARTPLIALRRAVGWSRRSVVVLFMTEGVTLGVVGGLVGTSLGLVASMLACFALGWVPSVPLTGLYVGVATGVVSGIVASMVPAGSAARLEPSLALRSS